MTVLSTGANCGIQEVPTLRGCRFQRREARVLQPSTQASPLSFARGPWWPLWLAASRRPGWPSRPDRRQRQRAAFAGVVHGLRPATRPAAVPAAALLAAAGSAAAGPNAAVLSASAISTAADSA